MLSLFENNKNVKNLSVYILSDCISDINLFNLQEIGYRYQRKVCIVDISNELSVFEEKGAGKYANETGGGYAASAKLLIPDLLLEEERVLYLDCDTLVVGDIEALLQIDMDNKPLGMAQDCIQNRYKKFISFEEKKRYFNSGVLLIDIPRWKENQCMDRMLWHLEHIRNQYPLPDQDLINVVLHEDIYCLPMKYNYLSQYYLYPYRGLKWVYRLTESCFYNKKEYCTVNEAAVLHFCGQTFIRPWYANSKHPSKKSYDFFYDLSPWSMRKQEKYRCKWEYKIQYWLWRYTPSWLSALCGRWMQSLFIRMQYKV